MKVLSASQIKNIQSRFKIAHSYEEKSQMHYPFLCIDPSIGWIGVKQL